MKPAPMTTTRAPGASSGARRSASSRVRIVCRQDRSPARSSRRARTPEATTRPSQATVSPSARVSVRASRSTLVDAGRRAATRRPRWPRRCRNGSRSRSIVPRSSSFESGGRLYGGCTSSPSTTIRPVCPAPRSRSHTRRPARPAPTTAIVLSISCPVPCLAPRPGRRGSRRPSPGRGCRRRRRRPSRSVPPSRCRRRRARGSASPSTSRTLPSTSVRGPPLVPSVEPMQLDGVEGRGLERAERRLGPG